MQLNSGSELKIGEKKRRRTREGRTSRNSSAYAWASWTLSWCINASDDGADDDGSPPDDEDEENGSITRRKFAGKGWRKPSTRENPDRQNPSHQQEKIRWRGGNDLINTAKSSLISSVTHYFILWGYILKLFISNKQIMFNRKIMKWNLEVDLFIYLFIYWPGHVEMESAQERFVILTVRSFATSRKKDRRWFRQNCLPSDGQVNWSDGWKLWALAGPCVGKQSATRSPLSFSVGPVARTPGRRSKIVGLVLD